jgi:hypothetical protein
MKMSIFASLAKAKLGKESIKRSNLVAVEHPSQEKWPVQQE